MPRAAAVTGQPKTVNLETAPTMDPAETAKRAVSAAERGARVLVIRNTVSAAVATWVAIREAGADTLLMQVEGGPALHHGRFAVEDRALLDQAAEKRPYQECLAGPKRPNRDWNPDPRTVSRCRR